jgi:hypothetical protein
VSLASFAALSACANLPGNSYLDGSHKYGRADPHLEKAYVIAVDGSTPVTINPVMVDPGDHVLTIMARPVAGFHDAPTLDVPFHVEPCKIYYLAVHRESPLTQKFDLVTQDVDPLAGCSIPK